MMADHDLRLASEGDKLARFRTTTDGHAKSPTMIPTKRCSGCGMTKSVVGGKTKSILGGRSSIHNPNVFKCKECLT